MLGVVVPIEVSGSSMAPALQGPHRVARCDTCDSQFSVTIDPGPVAGRVTCPACGKRGIDISRCPLLAGDTIWIDRTAYLFHPPRRWDVVVFHCPNDASQYCVKRIVGLPGEVIGIDGGNVVANGQVVSPPPARENGFPLRYESAPDMSRVVIRKLPWQLGPAEYFVVGDNSHISDDSRSWPSGPGLPRKLLFGKPLRAKW